MTRLMNVSWSISKAFFFFLGVYWLLSTAFDFQIGTDGDEGGVILAFGLAVAFTISELRYGDKIRGAS